MSHYRPSLQTLYMATIILGLIFVLGSTFDSHQVVSLMLAAFYLLVGVRGIRLERG
jgi:heme/copper-type cytochrome/quinol oxidase subunit 3